MLFAHPMVTVDSEYLCLKKIATNCKQSEARSRQTWEDNNYDLSWATLEVCGIEKVFAKKFFLL